jgi:hypothetical protein
MTRKTKTTAAPAATTGFIDAALMERAIALRAEGKTMKTIGAELGVKATGYLAKKIKATYGPDALARPTAQGEPQAKPVKGASVPEKRPSARRKPSTAKGA